MVYGNSSLSRKYDFLSFLKKSIQVHVQGILEIIYLIAEKLRVKFLL